MTVNFSTSQWIAVAMELMALESPINVGSIRLCSVANLALFITVAVSALTIAVLSGVNCSAWVNKFDGHSKSLELNMKRSLT